MKFIRKEALLLASSIAAAAGMATAYAGDGEYDRTGSVVDLQLPDPPTRRAGTAADSVGPARSTHVFTNDDSVDLPSHCVFDDTLPGCPNEEVDDGGDGGGVAPPVVPEVLTGVEASCGYVMSHYQYSMSKGMTKSGSACAQDGPYRYTGTGSYPLLPQVAARFSVVDENGTKLDTSRYNISWSGDCAGTGQSCVTGYMQSTKDNDIFRWAATATVTEIATGATTKQSATMLWTVCGIVNGSSGQECV